ncbi:dermonecrotic toxin domain-containing protein [Pseudomonas sp. EA_5y_Pfl2_R50]|uniref:dermonecrotic toxin domain-containing protein n=1 Tax=Pseudomonas sp. EA_5y_Pfl2_R50 TaxID=3088691 RepID=UPI0030DD35C0
MPTAIAPLLFSSFLDLPVLWGELGTAHALSDRDFQWLQHVQLATHTLRSEQTPPMLAHRVLLHTEASTTLTLAGSFILSATPEERAVMLYTPFEGLKKFDSLKALSDHLEQHLNRADEDDRLLAFMALAQRKHLVEKRGISVTYQFIEGDLFDDQRAGLEQAQNLNAQALLNELLHLPALDSLLENIFTELLAPNMPGLNQTQTRVSFHASAESADTPGPGPWLHTLTLGEALLLYYRHGGWPVDQTRTFSNPQRAARSDDQQHWEAAVKTAAVSLPVRVYKQMDHFWNNASADHNSRREFFIQAIRQRALVDIMLKRESGILDAQKSTDLLARIEPHGKPRRYAALETVRLWEYQANYVELAGSLMISHADACLYTPSHGLQVLKDYKDLKDTLLSKFKAVGHEEELYGLLSLEERRLFLGFDKPHVSGESIAGDVFAVLFAGIETKQRQNIEYALQVFRFSDGAVDLPALFDKALDIRSMIHERLLTLDTRERWSTRPALNGSLPSRVLADTATAQIKKFASVLDLISTEFANQPLAALDQQRTHLEKMQPRLMHALFVGVTGEACLRVLAGTLRQDEQAIVDTAFNPDLPDRARRKGLNGFRPDAYSISVQVSDQAEALPLASCLLLTERGGLDTRHSGRAVLWTPALGLEVFASVDIARQRLNQRLRDPQRRLMLLENLPALSTDFHASYTLGSFDLINENLLQNRTHSAINRFLERCQQVRDLNVEKAAINRALKALSREVIDTNLHRASALARALARQQSLPAWLGMATPDDQQLHLELLEQWRNNVEDEQDYLHALPTLRDYLRQTLQTRLHSRFQSQDLDPDQITITPALALAGPPVSLTDFALNLAHTAQHSDFNVTSGSTQALPAGLDRKAIRSLLLSLDVASTFADKITTALSAKDADAQQREQRYVRQLPWQLLQHAHQLKLQHRLGATAFDLITQVLDVPDGTARKLLNGANAIIRPLELIKTTGATAIKALGMYLIGPASGTPGPQVLYAPYHGEQAFSEFEHEAAVIAAFNVPGALQDLLLRRLPEAEQSIFRALFNSTVGQTSEITLASNPIEGNALMQLFKDNLALLPRLLGHHLSASLQADWEVAKNLFSSGIQLVRGLLPGKLACVQFLWNAFKDFQSSAEALQEHQWTRALETFIAGVAEMVSVGRVSLGSTLVTEQAGIAQEPQAITPATQDWKQIQPTASSRTALQTFEAPSISLKDLTPVSRTGTYEDPVTKIAYAPIAGKIYPVERPGAVWQIKGTDRQGPVLQHTANQQLILDPDRHTVHFGKTLSKMYNRYANERESRIWLNIEAQGMTEIRARHPEKARMLTQAIDLARFYAFNSLHNLAQLRNLAPGTRLDTFLKGFFGVSQVDADILAKIKKAVVPICNALVDPADDLMNTDRFVVGSNKNRETGLIAFVLDNDLRQTVHFTERFFNQELDWYKVGLTQPFNVDGHAQAATLIHEFAHQTTKAVDIASLEARRPFADLIATVTRYGADLKKDQMRYQREALSIDTPWEELFARWSHEEQDWIDLDELTETEHIAKEVLKITLSPTLEDAKNLFLSKTNPHPRIDTILHNADSIAFLICEMGRQLDAVASPAGALN